MFYHQILVSVRSSKTIWMHACTPIQVAPRVGVFSHPFQYSSGHGASSSSGSLSSSVIGPHFYMVPKFNRQIIMGHREVCLKYQITHNCITTCPIRQSSFLPIQVNRRLSCICHGERPIVRKIESRHNCKIYSEVTTHIFLRGGLRQQSEALHLAKIGKVHGYRDCMTFSHPVAAVHNSKDMNSSNTYTSPLTQPRRHSRKYRSCNTCHRVGHLQHSCTWNTHYSNAF